MECIILAAGKSSRFNGNKLLEKFNGKTLLEYALLFCILNDIKKVNITISECDLYYKDTTKGIHPVLDAANIINYKSLLDIKIKSQDPTKYGPAGAMMPWINEIKDDFIVLLGDNFINGKIVETIKPRMKPHTSIIGYIEKPEDEDNLRLGFINSETKKVKEKPHGQKSGKYFVGFCAFSNDTLKNLKNLKPSERGEYEITDLMNSNDNVELFDISTIDWKDITFSNEIAEMEKYIKHALG